MKVDVVVIGAGQAGLCVSYLLATEHKHLQHVVLEEHEPGHAWKMRWDDFKQLTPNWMTYQFPGMPYTGDSPHGFLSRDETVEYIRKFYKSFDCPVRTDVRVTKVERIDGEYQVWRGTELLYYCKSVIVCTGMCQVPLLPRFASQVPPNIFAIHCSEFRNADQLQQGGATLVIGAGQTGAQVAKVIANSGKSDHVYLSTGAMRALPRTMYGKDICQWMNELELYDRTPPTRIPHPDAKYSDNKYFPVNGVIPNERELFPTGVNILSVAEECSNITLLGRAFDCNGQHFSFDNRMLPEALRESFVFDNMLRDAILKHADHSTLDMTDNAQYYDVEKYIRNMPRISQLDCDQIKNVIYCLGYQTNFRSFIHINDDGLWESNGYPIQPRGITCVDGLYFCGVHYRHNNPRCVNFYQAMLVGVKEAADIIVDHLVNYLQ
jgi:putative flavoprotein involved in K+ transport